MPDKLSLDEYKYVKSCLQKCKRNCRIFVFCFCILIFICTVIFNIIDKKSGNSSLYLCCDVTVVAFYIVFYFYSSRTICLDSLSIFKDKLIKGKIARQEEICKYMGYTYGKPKYLPFCKNDSNIVYVICFKTTLILIPAYELN